MRRNILQFTSRNIPRLSIPFHYVHRSGGSEPQQDDGKASNPQGSLKVAIHAHWSCQKHLMQRRKAQPRFRTLFNMIRGMDIAVQVGIVNPLFHLVSSRRREAAKKNELLLFLGFHATIVEVVQVFGDTGFGGRLLSMH